MMLYVFRYSYKEKNCDASTGIITAEFFFISLKTLTGLIKVNTYYTNDDRY